MSDSNNFATNSQAVNTTGKEPVSPAAVNYSLPQKREYIRNRMETYDQYNTPYAPMPNGMVINPVPAQQNQSQGIYPQSEQEHEYEPPQRNKRGHGCSPFSFVASVIRGIWHFIMLIKNTLITLLIIAIVACLGTVFIVVYKPPLLWNPIKTFLNNGITSPIMTAVDLKDVYEKINTEGSTTKEVTLSDPEFSLIVRTNTLLDDKCFVVTSASEMDFYMNIDTQERPLWFIVRTKINDNDRIEISSAGFGRFNTPRQLSSVLNDTLGVVFSFIEKQITADSSAAAFQQIVSSDLLNKDLTIKHVEFKDRSIVLSY